MNLKRQDALIAHHLDRKIFDVNEAPRLYKDRVEDVSEILTALIREERLQVTHVSSGLGKRRSGQPRRFVIDPYTLLVYKKGLYLVGFSHHHEAIRTFGFDGIRSVDWLRGERFEYPEDYHPSQIVEGAFGLIGGEPREVRIRFSPAVAHYIQRSRWHPSQKIRTLRGEGGAIDLVMNVALTVELRSWILSFGSEAEVLEPEALRRSVAEEVQEVVGMYADRNVSGMLSGADE